MNGWLYPGKLQNIKNKEFEIIHCEMLRAITHTEFWNVCYVLKENILAGGGGKTITNHQNPFQVKQRNIHDSKELS